MIHFNIFNVCLHPVSELRSLQLHFERLNLSFVHTIPFFIRLAHLTQLLQ